MREQPHFGKFVLLKFILPHTRCRVCEESQTAPRLPSKPTWSRYSLGGCGSGGPSLEPPPAPCWQLGRFWGCLLGGAGLSQTPSLARLDPWLGGWGPRPGGASFQPVQNPLDPHSLTAATTCWSTRVHASRASCAQKQAAIFCSRLWGQPTTFQQQKSKDSRCPPGAGPGLQQRGFPPCFPSVGPPDAGERPPGCVHTRCTRGKKTHL